jgi:large subunit ribosomal protein L1
MKKRSKQFIKAKEEVRDKVYSIEEAIKLIKSTAKEKFDASVEAHIRLGIDVSKSDQQVKGTATLPHGSGKKLKVAVFVPPEKEKEVREAGADMVGGDDLIDKIKKTKKCDFDVAVATPDVMRSLSQIAKILGPRGLMPNPKAGTVVDDPVQALKELQSGRINFRNDPSGIIHQSIGKISFDDKKLVENYDSLVEAIKKSKPAKVKREYIRSITLCSSMGPGVKVK